MPSFTVAGLAYIAVSYTMRTWHERLVERNLPKHLRENLIVRPVNKELVVKINNKPVERGVTC